MRICFHAFLTSPSSKSSSSPFFTIFFLPCSQVNAKFGEFSSSLNSAHKALILCPEGVVDDLIKEMLGLGFRDSLTLALRSRWRRNSGLSRPERAFYRAFLMGQVSCFCRLPIWLEFIMARLFCPRWNLN